FRLAHSFVELGFCASVTLRTANLPNGMSFSLPYSFLSFCQLCRALLGAPYESPLIAEPEKTLNLFSTVSADRLS
ncbi:MAG: hypothetical protein IKJ42_00440, partial [Bacteroidaceae bacterium]|nr:hypothetical protein [Bacteroidaceae bacterium]